MHNNPVLAERFRANMAAYGIEDQGDDPNAGSTDMANVSWVCPTIHPDLAICEEGVAGHSIVFRDAAVTPRADETTLLAATLVAQTAYELFADPALVEAAWAAFRRRLTRTSRRRHRRGWAVGPVLPSAAARPAGRADFEPAAPPIETDRHLTAAGDAPAAPVSGGSRG